MFITVAGKKKEVKDGITVVELIEVEKVENAQYVTVTVNDEFVNSADFQSKTLNENDTVEFLYFMGGGSF
ncbi:bifunctional sulfur carrier protein/thiazole synthase protein [Clostridium homopropionicum DSM 5847]|uniref:Bifunctional sulfur carrier protein/thiazole synthase protein n=1 Tax=Clostridium homopropionicum DSM 5847 TaxID=1121318 RepID=A0A0L6ZCL0_9CLOT|nr:sulfur carrier protein ThiS [Clostridium homopropionicum]KOA20701.1 bifunctional sulfur carrier protein/thiazole synthase protein [Clostridium homopropionicum DSM 5847]SFF91154.1 sulfur carrier protein [Clostridium homopropionicum]